MEGKFTVEHLVGGTVVSSQEFANPITTEGVEGIIITQMTFPEPIVLHSGDEMKVSFEAHPEV